MEEESPVDTKVAQVTDVSDSSLSHENSETCSTKAQGEEREIAINGDLQQPTKEGKSKDEEIALDGEFIKVERELFDVKGVSHSDEATKESPSTAEHSSNSMESRDSTEYDAKIKKLEHELERVANLLHHSESGKAKLMEDVAIAKQKLEEKSIYCEGLEVSQNRLREQVREVEEKYKSELDKLQEAFGAQEAKHKDLINIKEAFDALNVELNGSRKRLEDLEQELQISTGNAQKFEELSKHSSFIAESESQNASEFERLLEIAKSNAQEMEGQMTSLQEELKALREKIAENQRTEEALNNTVKELSSVQGELELSKWQVQEIELKLASRDVVLEELTQELKVQKEASEKQNEDFVALQNLLLSTKEDLQVRHQSLEEINLKLQGETKMRETIETALRSKEAEFSSVQEELAKVMGEKAALEAVVEDLNRNILQTKELCGDLEGKLALSDENFCRVESFLSQALSQNAELDKKITDLEALHQESGTAAATATQRNRELEDIVRASAASEEQTKSQMREMEIHLVFLEQKNAELEQQLNLAELNHSDTDRKLKEYSERTSELTTLLKKVEEECTLLKMQLKDYEEKISNMESTLSLLSLRNSELEQELKDAAEKCAEHEVHASVKHLRNLELEDLIQISHSKAEHADKKVTDMELLLESSNYRLKELEEQITVSEKRCQDIEVESKKFSDRVSELEAEKEALKEKSSSLEITLQSANEKEHELTESLKFSKEEWEKCEVRVESLNEKLSGTEELVEVLRNELKSTQEKLECTENDLKVSILREHEVLGKLNSLEERIKEQEKMIEQATARSAEWQLLHESLTKDSELKLREAMENFTQRDSDAVDLYNRLKIFEDQVVVYKQKETETAEREAALKAELGDSLMKLDSYEKSLDEFKSKILEVESRAGQSSSENELLVETNLKLKVELETHQTKVNELQEQLHAVHAEKENVAEQLTSHMKTITDLTDQHSRGLELQNEAESRVRQAELQLKEAIEGLTQRDSDTRDLNEKLSVLENQIKVSQEHVNEAVAVSERRKCELEEALLKISHLEGIGGELHGKVSQFEKDNEDLAETNMKLTQQRAAHETKINELKTELSMVLAEKQETFEQVHSLKKSIEDLTQQLATEGHQSQSQISSLMEENSMLIKTYQDTKEDLQAVIMQLEEQLKERDAALNSHVESLKAEKSVLERLITELEEQLISAEKLKKEQGESLRAEAAEKEASLISQLEELARKQLQERDLLNEKVAQLQDELNLANTAIAEQKEASSRIEFDRQGALKDFEAKCQETIILTKQVEELEQKLQLAEAKLNEKAIEDSKKVALLNEELDNLKNYLGQTAELEKKVVELETQLNLAKTKFEQSKEGIQMETAGVEVKSRDRGPTLTTPSKRKSKKRTEVASDQTADIFSAKTTPQATEEPSFGMNVKFILGLALVSMIIGVILGKRY